MDLNGTVLPSPCNETLLQNNISYCNNSYFPVLPRELTFNDDSLVSVITCSCLFVIAACGNLTVFITLFRNRHIKSRVNVFIMHLSIADLIVTFVMLPLETVWHMTVAWKAGDSVCRIMMFFRAFGFYLSSFILVTISLDRYFAIMHPLSLNDADRRGKIMLALAWLFSAVASIPQSVIFHVEKHPQFKWFTQCVTFNFFPSPSHELAYNLFNVIAVYGLPLIIITATYSRILCEISKKSRQSKDQLNVNSIRTKPGLRRSAMGIIERARIRTLKMTLVIVGVFVLCWTPYFVFSAWWWFDKESAAKMDPKLRRGLFLFAVSNSCMDPIVYGMFTIDFRREFQRCCYCSKTNYEESQKAVNKAASVNRPNLRKSNNSTSKSSERLYYRSQSNASSGFKRYNMLSESMMASRSSSGSVTKENSVGRANINNFVGIRCAGDKI